MPTINITNVDAFIKAFDDYNCGKTPMAHISAENFNIEAYDTTPLEGFEFSENFPNCCPSHINLFNIGLDAYKNFPNCCEAHKKLNTANWFNKNKYDYLPLKFINTFAYTWHAIATKIDTENWYKEITDYIEHTKQSYGSFPLGYGSPFGLNIYLANIRGNINDNTEIATEKKEKLIAFIDKYFEAIKPPSENTDINLLITTYQKWLKDFPFEIPFLSHLKEHFTKQMPILKSIGETNIYSGLATATLKTKNELIILLIELTEKMLTEINAFELYKNGEITDIQKTNIEIINAKRNLELKILKEKPIEERKHYIKILKEWLKGEQEYLNQLTTALSKIIPQKGDDEIKLTKTEKLLTNLRVYGFFEIEKVKCLNKEQQNQLMELINKNDLPYKIAMFDFLGFIKMIENKYMNSKYKMYKELAILINEGRNERGVKANISTLNKKSKEDKKKYTAHIHRENVIKDYQNIK